MSLWGEVLKGIWKKFTGKGASQTNVLSYVVWNGIFWWIMRVTAGSKTSETSKFASHCSAWAGRGEWWYLMFILHADYAAKHCTDTAISHWRTSLKCGTPSHSVAVSLSQTWFCGYRTKLFPRFVVFLAIFSCMWLKRTAVCLPEVTTAYILSVGSRVNDGTLLLELHVDVATSQGA